VVLVNVISILPHSDLECVAVISASASGCALAGVVSSAPPSSAPSATASAIIQYFLIRASSSCFFLSLEVVLAHDTTPSGGLMSRDASMFILMTMSTLHSLVLYADTTSSLVPQVTVHSSH